MKGAFPVVGLVSVLMCSGCSEAVSPAGPSSVRSVSTSAGPAAGGETPVSPGAPAVPFNGSFEGTQTTTPLAPPEVFVDGSAAGNATHLGRFAVKFPHIVNFVTATGKGTYTFTAANGDTLTADFIGKAQVGPIVSIVEEGTITGGTGRFAGAEGTFVVRRQFVPATGVTAGSFEGTVSSVGGGEQP